jgi:hypothetical protein
MGAEGAASVVFRREIAASDDPAALRAQRIKEYRQELVHPYCAAERGLVDDVIAPAHTRGALVSAPFDAPPHRSPVCVFPHLGRLRVATSRSWAARTWSP